MYLGPDLGRQSLGQSNQDTHEHYYEWWDEVWVASAVHPRFITEGEIYGPGSSVLGWWYRMKPIGVLNNDTNTGTQVFYDYVKTGSGLKLTSEPVLDQVIDFDTEPCAVENGYCKCAGDVKSCGRNNGVCYGPKESNGGISCVNSILETQTQVIGRIAIAGRAC